MFRYDGGMTTLLSLEPYQEVLDRDWNLVGMWIVSCLLFLAVLAEVVAILRWLFL